MDSNLNTKGSFTFKLVGTILGVFSFIFGAPMAFKAFVDEKGIDSGLIICALIYFISSLIIYYALNNDNCNLKKEINKLNVLNNDLNKHKYKIDFLEERNGKIEKELLTSNKNFIAYKKAYKELELTFKRTKVFSQDDKFTSELTKSYKITSKNLSRDLED